MGVALGSGTDAAVESAQIVLVKNDPLDAVAALQLGRKNDAEDKVESSHCL